MKDMASTTIWSPFFALSYYEGFLWGLYFQDSLNVVLSEELSLYYVLLLTFFQDFSL
jgi:hypothetical protein